MPVPFYTLFDYHRFSAAHHSVPEHLDLAVVDKIGVYSVRQVGGYKGGLSFQREHSHRFFAVLLMAGGENIVPDRPDTVDAVGKDSVFFYLREL